MTTTTPFVACIRRAMQPLADRFGLRIADEAETPSASEVLYLNKSTGLRVMLDWRDFRPFLTLYKLVNGLLPPDRPEAIDLHVPLQAFDVDDLLILRAGAGSPVGKMLGRRDADEACHLLEEYATALERYASDVLDGDFSVFAELNRVVAERYAAARKARG